MRHILIPAALACLLLCGLIVQTPAAEKPNIILVMADDQGWGDMAYNGHPVLKTPNFDAAAAAGLSAGVRDTARTSPDSV